MTIFILIVEDEENFVTEIRHVLNDLTTAAEVKIAKSRDTAYSFLDNDFFDLIILDLKIPTIDGSLDADPQHGHAVFTRARSIAPGTPIFVLTGSPAEDFIPDLLLHQQQMDIWGEGRSVGTVNFLQKYKFSECPAKLGPLITAVEALSEVELEKGEVELSREDDRLIRIFARRFRGTRCVVSVLGGGLSSAKVVRLRMTNREGALVHDAVAKLASLQEVRDEGNRFDNLVARLEASATPRKLAILEFGARAQAGIFYGLAAGFEETAFGVTTKGQACAAVLSVQNATKRWRDGVPETRRTIGEVRRRLLSDEALTELQSRFTINWVHEFEEHPIQTRWACIHGDLHGNNILVSSNGTSVLIDYGDVGDGPSSLDPITLEFSLLFHPAGPFRSGTQLTTPAWPSLQQAKQWGVLDQYLKDCPAATFIMECRNWASQVAAGKREIAGSAYSYLIRQLKYQDTDKNLILALLEGVKTFYEST